MLYALDWDSSADDFLQRIRTNNCNILPATAGSGIWKFTIRFPDHAEFSAIKEYCETEDIELEIAQLYDRTDSSTGRHFGLTEPQREALSLAVRDGYYSIPGERSTKTLAAELGVSDQAVTERLRRAIVTLTENTIFATENATEEDR